MKLYWFDLTKHDQAIRTKPKNKVFFLLGFMVILGVVGLLLVTPPNLDPVVQTTEIPVETIIKEAPIETVPKITNPAIKNPITSDEDDEDEEEDDD